MSRRREVSDEEETLWRSITRTVKPLKGRRTQPEPKATEPRPKPPSRRAASPAPSPVMKPVGSTPMPKEPALAPLDRRARQRLKRGTQSIDARLDLHGRTQSQAHAALLRFLRRAQADGAKTVLVITGKGPANDPHGERGVLKRQVPLWLSLPEFRGLVVGFGAAGVGHGGEGALYVRLRRGRAAD